jgi:hypothetical protein
MRTRLAVIVAVLAVLGAGCGGGGPAHKSSDSAPTPTSSSSTPVTASPTPTGPLTTGPGVLPGEKPPVLSAEAKQHTPTGALAFAVYYFKALDWSFASNDAYLLRKIGTATCSACNRYITALDGLAASERLTGSRITIVSGRLVAGSFKVKSDEVAEFVLNDQAAVLTKPSAPPSTVAPAATHDHSLVFVSWIDGGWKVIDEGSPS